MCTVYIIGFLYTNEEVVRSFIPGEELVLNVNISNNFRVQYITSIAWYHNGTQITPGNKYSITYSNSSTSLTNTSLTIQNMVGSDAGKYEVKIKSIEYYGDSSPHCDSILLPLLETYAIYTPVTFTVQEHCIPTYDPQSVISSYYTTECADGKFCNIDLRSSGHNVNDIPLQAGRYQSEWYKNGVRTNKYNSSVIHEQGLVINSLHITYNNTEDISGNYVGLTRTNILDGLFMIECPAYYFIQGPLPRFLLYEFIFEASYWKIYGEFCLQLVIELVIEIARNYSKTSNFS